MEQTRRRARADRGYAPFYGEQFTLVQMRKMAAFYLRGTRGGAKLRAELLACPSVSRLREMVEEIYTEEQARFY